jgi:hypothetical protein
MGFELGNGMLYMMESNGRQSELGEIFSGDIEIDTISPNEMPEIIYNFQKAATASFSGEMTLAGLDCLGYKPFEPTETFNIEHSIGILVQARWHKKKRINKKWLKRYGMKHDTVKMKAKARTLSYNTETGDCEFEVDKLEYIWRPDQKRKNLKIEM